MNKKINKIGKRSEVNFGNDRGSTTITPEVVEGERVFPPI